MNNLLDEEAQWIHGFLGKDWTQKVLDDGRVLMKTSMAYEAYKGAPTQWIDLTVWPDYDTGSTSAQVEYMKQTQRGSRVLVYGKVQTHTYQNQDGQPIEGYRMNVWEIAKVIKKPKQASTHSSGSGHLQSGKGDDYKKKFAANTGLDHDTGERAYDPNEEPF